MRRLLFVLMCLCLVTPLFAANLLVNPGLETGDTTGWGPRFGAGAVQVITSNPSPRSGLYCLRDYGRTATWHGVWQSQNMLNVVQKGVAYPSSVWVRTNTVSPVNVACTMQYNPSSGAVYNQIANRDVDNTAWVELANPAYLILNNDATEATWYIEAPGSTTAEIYVDDASFGTDEEADGLPYDPKETPENPDGTVGTPVDAGGGVWTVNNAVLSFKAGHDPNDVYRVNPKIAYHNVYLQSGLPADANLILVDYYLPQTSLDDPNQSLTLASVVPPIKLKQGTTYKWQVEMVMKDALGNPYPDGDPNNILGVQWSFTAASAVPAITAITDHQLTDTSGNTSFTVTATAVANNYRWFKVVGNQDTTANGETNDTMLTDGGIYSGTQTATLVITGAAASGADDARIYAKAYNGVPGNPSTTVSPSSAVRWFWYPRLVNLYAFDVMNTVDSNSVTPDAVSGYSMVMLSNDIGVDKPVLVSGPDPNNFPPAPGIAGNSTSLKFHNPRTSPADPNNGDAQYAKVYNQWAGAFKDVTISCWVYNAGCSNWNRILDFGNNQNQYMYLCLNTGSVNNAARFEIRTSSASSGSAQSVTSQNGAVPVGQWTHIAATLTGTTGRIYINGELRGTNTNLVRNPIDYGPTTQNWLGRSQYGAGDGYFNGKIDQLKIYNYALSTVEVGQEYLADTLLEYVCNRQIYDLASYDTNTNCKLDLPDFATMAARWLEDDRVYPAE